MELHVSEDLLGAILTNDKGYRRRIMAVWLEPNGNLRPTFVALTVDEDEGDFLKISLPDREWNLL